jgi:hypothetical protein
MYILFSRLQWILGGDDVEHECIKWQSRGAGWVVFTHRANVFTPTYTWRRVHREIVLLLVRLLLLLMPHLLSHMSF